MRRPRASRRGRAELSMSDRRWYDGIQLEELDRRHDDFKYAESKMRKSIGHTDVTGYNIKKVYRINNKYTWPRYVKRRDKIYRDLGRRHVQEKRLFHGSPKADVIARQGFDRGFAKKTGMFGAGVYFAEHSSKSNNYAFGNHQPCPAHGDRKCSSCSRKLLICKVALGRQYETSLRTVSSLPAGYHSVKANQGLRLQFPEYVIYDDDQVYPSYLIEYTTNYATPANDNCRIM